MGKIISKMFAFTLVLQARFSPHALFRRRRRKIMTTKLHFRIPSPVKKFVLALQSLKIPAFTSPFVHGAKEQLIKFFAGELFRQRRRNT